MPILPRFACALVAVAGLAAASPASAVDPSTAVPLAGVWELSSAGGQKSCRLQLRTDVAGTGFGIGAPPACRISIPSLSRLASWTPGDGNRIVLDGSNGKPVMTLEPVGAELRYRARADGEEFTLVPIGGEAKRTAEKRAAALSAPPSPAAGSPSTATSKAALRPQRTLPRPEEIPGIYEVGRLAGPSECAVKLEPAPAATASGRAALLPGCRDGGVTIFDPVAWSFVEGKLTLVARKGHSVTLALRPDGLWHKDPPTGAELSLTRR